MNLLFLDMEGPLSIQDNAYEMMEMFPHGGRIFDLVKRYDRLLSQEGRDDYDPGDGRVRIEGDGIVDSEGNAIQAYDLSAEVDEKVKQSLSGLTG